MVVATPPRTAALILNRQQDMHWFSSDKTAAKSVNGAAIQSVPHENLRLFCILRLLPLAGMYLGVYYLLQSQTENLHWDFIFVLLATLSLVIGLTWLRSFHGRPIGNGEFFGHLMVDISIYSLLMFNTGGATNPFISYLLVPVTIAAIALPSALTWLTGLACLASYSLLLMWHIPLPVVAPGGHHLHQNNGINLHTLGMWLNFMVSALLIAYFVNRMARTIADQEHSLNLQHQKQLEDDQLLAVATVAASAAHELGTPLNTMKLLCDEWLSGGQERADDSFRQDLAIFHRQVERCQHTLQKLAGRAREYSGQGLVTQKAREYFTDLLDDWLVMRPDVRAEFNIQGDDIQGGNIQGDNIQSDNEGAEIRYHPSLSASIHNLLNNAADASPEKITIAVHWHRDSATMEIRDFGQGFEKDQLLNQPLHSDKPTGMGLGLYLARTILARHRAVIDIGSAASGGTIATIKLPLRQGDD